MKVKILLEKDEDGWWVATVPSLPGVVSQGKTKPEAEKNVKEAIELHLETLLESGLPLQKDKNKQIEFLDVSIG
ncbi:type II toxin-antitoxin system HicB family antitoxin [Candidatus Micrarchaeota archaeon]|nr:type II toxin-antitoxin system HicB family antitoxin [Candidatus Micrarchaeota archaeon]